jgi:NAD(P)-dependent dehydrogenase (short-subunit alcohol dehydrogenase family)
LSSEPALSSVVLVVIHNLQLDSGGIGYYTVRELARKGAKVYLGARSETRANDALRKLKEEGIGNGQVEFLKVDLVSIRDSKRAAEEFLSKEDKLDILSQYISLAIVEFKP